MSYGWALDLSDYKLVDLTPPCNADTIYWPTSPSKFELTVLAYGETPGGWFYAANSQLPPTGATLLALPMKIEGGSGAPVRVVTFIYSGV